MQNLSGHFHSHPGANIKERHGPQVYPPKSTSLTSSPPPSQGWDTDATREICALWLFPQLSFFGTLPDHVGSSILKAALPYAKYNANPSPSLCLWSKNSAQQGRLPWAHRFCAQVPPLIFRGSCHSIRFDFLPSTHSLPGQLLPFQDFCQHQS